MTEWKYVNSFMRHKLQNIYTVINIEKCTQTVIIKVCVNSGNGLVMITWFGIFRSWTPGTTVWTPWMIDESFFRSYVVNNGESLKSRLGDTMLMLDKSINLNSSCSSVLLVTHSWWRKSSLTPQEKVKQHTKELTVPHYFIIMTRVFLLLGNLHEVT